MIRAQQYADQVAQFTRVTTTLSTKMYVTPYGGNAAWKLEDDLVLITPTQLNKGEITADDVVFINMDGDTVEGTRHPTGEKPMCLSFFRQRPDIESIIHCHAPNIGAFAIMEGPNPLMRPIFPETSHEVGPVPVVPYGEPLIQQLADNFKPFVQKYNSFIMENHGVVVMSPDTIQWTMMNLELLEMSAYSILQAVATGRELKELTREDVRALDGVMKKRNCPMFGAPGVNASLEDLYF